MNLLKRVRNLWALASMDGVSEITMQIRKKREKAVFIFPDRTKEILAANPEATIDDVLA